MSDRFVSVLLNLAFLAPSVIEAIIDGRQPAALTAKGLMFGDEIPMLWSERLATKSPHVFKDEVELAAAWSGAGFYETSAARIEVVRQVATGTIARSWS